MMFIHGSGYPYYIKKEDAHDVVKWQRRSGALVMGSIAMVMLFMQWFVSPELLSLYADTSTAAPFMVRYSQPFTVFFGLAALVGALYFLISHPDYKKVDKVASKYKKGELIKTTKLIDHRFQWSLMTVFIVMILYFVFSIIIPIYNLSSGV